jgi:hypothetical protein
MGSWPVLKLPPSFAASRLSAQSGQSITANISFSRILTTSSTLLSGSQHRPLTTYHHASTCCSRCKSLLKLPLGNLLSDNLTLWLLTILSSFSHLSLCCLAADRQPTPEVPVCTSCFSLSSLSAYIIYQANAFLRPPSNPAMNAHCRYYPAPRPSLKTERSPKPSYVYCSCPTPCGRESCTGPEQARNFPNYPDGSTAPFPPQPPSPHVHFLGLYQTYLVDYDYDRSSTVVMPNECALPARGCPGKTYFSTQVANVARTGRRLGRCATPAASRGNSRSRMNMSPPPSPSLCARHILYPGLF